MWRTISCALAISVGVAAQAPAQTLGFWEFDAEGPTLVDSSENGLDGQVGFDVSTETDPVPEADSPSGADDDYSLRIQGGPVVADDSENQLLDLHDQAFTAELWIKVYDSLEGLSWRGTVYYGRHGTGWGIGTLNQELKFTLFGVVDMFPGINLEADDQWHHLAFKYEPEIGVEFFLDGEFFTFQEETRPMIQTNTNILWLGTEDGASRPIPAYIDRFRVTEGLLADDELDSDAANPKPVTDDTIVYFPFNTDLGGSFDDIAGGLTALVGTSWFAQMQAPDYVADAPSGDGLALDFVQGDHAIVRDPENQMNFQDQNFTLEAWIKPGEFSQASATIMRYGGSETAPPDSGGYGLNVNQSTETANLIFYQIDAGSSYTITTPEGSVPFDGEWHHLAVVYSEDEFKVFFYVDGELVHEEDYALGIITALDASLLHLGGQWDGRESYVGMMDRLRVSASALAPEELDYSEPVTAVGPWSLY